ncbi:MAG: hypothetical protein J2P17_32230, partial [Mycobacterium sp.]|nr:hypothetical protein [Mycobacterium sp.]
MLGGIIGREKPEPLTNGKAAHVHQVCGRICPAATKPVCWTAFSASGPRDSRHGAARQQLVADRAD